MKIARRATVGVAVVLVGFAVVPATTAAATAPSAREAKAWYGEVLDDLHPLQSVLPGALSAASAWAGGSESAGAARQEFDRDAPALLRTERLLRSLSALPGHASARNDYAAGIDLYAEAVMVDRAATEVTPGALQGQLQKSSQRIRALGDIVFDEGTAELAPLLGPSLSGDDVAAAAHVPDWSAVGVAPAAPLVSAWQASGTASPGSQPKASWAAQVKTDGAPTQARVHAALAGRPTPASLGEMASVLNRAEARLTSAIAPPAGDPLAANRQRLGLLADAEGVLDAEAGRLSRGVPAGALAKAATDLVALGGGLRAQS